MTNPLHLVQSHDHPLFPDMLWSRPENKQFAGKLLIIGGNTHSFAAVAEGFSEALSAGAGYIRTVLPDSLRKTVGKFIDDVGFVPSTPSGSFSQQSLAEWLDYAAWADACLLAGDFGRNSETTIVIEKFMGKSPIPMTLVQDAIDYVPLLEELFTNRTETLLVPDMSQLQKIGAKFKSTAAFTHSMDIAHMVSALQMLTTAYPPYIAVQHLDMIFIAAQGQVSTTKVSGKVSNQRIAAHATVWWMQNQSKPFEALTTSVHHFS